MHPWLGRRLRITRISHKGQRRYVNAAIVFHDPAESHPFHVLHDDGASAWLAIQEKRGIVHAVEGDGGNQGLRTRVSRRFTWLTPVVRRETAVVERTQAFGAPSSEHVSQWPNSHARERDLFLAAARGAANRSEPYGHQSRVFPSVPPNSAFPHADPARLNASSARLPGFALRSVLASSPAPLAPLAPAEQPAPRERVANVGGGVRFATPAERSPWDGILEEFGAAPALVAAAAVKADTTKLDRHGGALRTSTRPEEQISQISSLAAGEKKGSPKSLEALEAAARAVGAAAADVGTSYEYLVGAAARDRDPRFFTSDSAESARLCLDAPALSLRDMRRDVRARALEDAAAVLRPAALALCAAATREKRFPPSDTFEKATVPSLVARVRADDSDDSDVSLQSDDSERDIPARRGNDANESSFGARLAARERNARCAGCDARLELSFGFRACALCGEAACADCMRERRDALAADLARAGSGIEGGSPGTYPGTDASAYVFLCVATPTCLASATAAARRAGLARHPSAQNADVFTVSSLRAAGGFRSVAGVLPSPTGTRATSPVANVRLNTLADAEDALSIAPACVRLGEAFAKFRAEARWGADGTADGAAAPALVFQADARVPASFLERLERYAGELLKAPRINRGKESPKEEENDSATTTGRKRRRRTRAKKNAAEDSNGDGDSNGEERSNERDPPRKRIDSIDSDSFPSLSAAASRLAHRAGAGECAAEAADAGAAAREARLLFETNARVSPAEAGPETEETPFADALALSFAMRDGRPLTATTTVSLSVVDDDTDDDADDDDDDRPDRPDEPGPGCATRRRFVPTTGTYDAETIADGAGPPPAIGSALATTPFAALVHPLGALNIMAYSDCTETHDCSRSRTSANSRRRFRETGTGTRVGTHRRVVVSEAEVEASPFAGVPDVYVDPSETALNRVFENVVLEKCARRGDVAVSLGVSTLDACFAASRDSRADISTLVNSNTLASEKREMKNETVARLWTVFAREDAPLLARWLALRGSALDEPCLAFEAQREARETAAALAAAARAARALADAHPGEPRAREAAAAAAAAAEAGEAARRGDTPAWRLPLCAAGTRSCSTRFRSSTCVATSGSRPRGATSRSTSGRPSSFPRGVPASPSHTPSTPSRAGSSSPRGRRRARCGWRTSLGFWRAATPSAATRSACARRSCARRCAWRRACGRRARGSSTPPRETRTKNKKRKRPLSRARRRRRAAEKRRRRWRFTRRVANRTANETNETNETRRFVTHGGSSGGRVTASA